ncbi:MAG TPA: zinc-binding dehydrogenase [Steroidobacteraceae bacterium]|jgi:NADPH2:quinone reductase|nr:zinc-binding dehydrogenase [Steroidobacteraceae bacterium]
MNAASHLSFLQLRSLAKKSGEMELSLQSTSLPKPEPDELIVRIEAAPINPSDLGLLLANADWSHAKVSGTAQRPTLTAALSGNAVQAMAARIDISMPVGNEGAGTVTDAGTSASAQALLGKKIAVLGGAMYAQYRCVKLNQCLVLPPGASAAEGASCFVNPLTALGMVGTMRREGHKALVHTAAASNLGQMLNRLCLADGVALVNIVRKQEQEDLLRAAGAVHVCRTDSATFLSDLTDALATTGATIAFDAIGGGPLAGQILGCMEAAVNRGVTVYSRYGSTTHKQVYLYGSLDMSPAILSRNYGMAWGIGGWLVTPYIEKIGPLAFQELKERVARELKSTFASRYSHEISLAEALQPEVVAAYSRGATGQKYLINPNKDL